LEKKRTIRTGERNAISMFGLGRSLGSLQRVRRSPAKEATGQIRPMPVLGWEISILSLHWRVRTILEIGTWKGEGSTRWIANDLRIRNRIIPRVTAHSIESNQKMSLIAAENHLQGAPGPNLVRGRVVNAKELQNGSYSPKEKLVIDSDREA
jgi:predicted O-methyltransferase YrrM